MSVFLAKEVAFLKKKLYHWCKFQHRVRKLNRYYEFLCGVKKCLYLEVLHTNLLFLSIHRLIMTTEIPFLIQNLKMSNLKTSKSRYIALFMISKSIKKLFLIDYVNIYFFNIIFNRFCQVKECRVTPNCLHRDL